MNTYLEVGLHYGLTGMNLTRYVTYMSRRWGRTEDETLKCKMGFAGTIAQKFLTGKEYEGADAETKATLLAVDADWIAGILPKDLERVASKPKPKKKEAEQSELTVTKGEDSITFESYRYLL